VFLVDGCRTPFLKARGVPGPFSASDLAFLAGRSLLSRQKFAPADVDELILGCTIQAPEEANIARVVSLRLGCGFATPAWTVHRNCASGMQAIDSAARSIGSGRADLVLAGGTEAMSRAPLLLSEAMTHWLGEWWLAKSLADRVRQITKFRPAHIKPVIALLKGLTDPTVGLTMGQTAEILAERFAISREEMDSFAVQSHKRLAAAQEEGLLSEIEPVFDWNGRCYEDDDGVRPDSAVEKLARLRPAFDKPFGQVTPGNSAQITDGACLVVLASEDAVEKYGLRVLARIVDCEWAGVDPAQMGLGPVHAVAGLLRRRRIAMKRIDYWEINEAFAAQVLACLQAWRSREYCRLELGLRSAMGEIEPERLNIDGGGISLGHPVGCSGARIVLHLARILERQDAKRGIATLCVGGGQGGAMLIERDRHG